MNGLDCLVICLLIVIAYVGSNRTPLQQLVAAFSAVSSLWLAVLAYRHLAFLTEQSGARVAVLALLALAVGFLSYDICTKLTRRFLGKVGAKRSHRHNREEPPTNPLPTLASIGVGLLGTLTTVWLGAGILSGSRITAIQQQVNHSFIVASLDRIAQPPTLFRQTAHLLGPFSSPQVFIAEEPSFDDSVQITGAFSDLDAATAKAKQSVNKVTAWGCGVTSTGSGFVAGSQLIVTNAHVIAGADRISIQDSGGATNAVPVVFDPKLDIAILHTATPLNGQPLKLRSGTAPAGSIGSVIGYPEGGSLTTSDGIILSSITARGYDIYGQSTVTRLIYAFRGQIVPGNSGGPLIDTSGSVMGLIFGNATSQANTGFALPASLISPELQAATKQTSAVDTGSCTR